VDLSDMIFLYEANSTAVDKRLVSQYLQDEEIADDFAVYYDIFNKYKSDYQIDSILAGNPPKEIVLRAKEAPFDEKLSITGLLLDSVNASMKNVIEQEDMISALLADLKEVKSGAKIEDRIATEKAVMARDERRGILNIEKRRQYEGVLSFLSKHEDLPFEAVKGDYDALVAKMRSDAKYASAKLENLFAFAEEAWQSGQELLIIVTELTISHYAARFISRYGSERYYKHSEELMFYERNTEIIKQIEKLAEL